MIKHNKKRNTFLIYEQLIALTTRLAAEGHNNEAHAVLSFIKEHFNKNTELLKEFKLANSILTTKDCTKDEGASIIEETLKEAKLINENRLNEEKTKLIEGINNRISMDLFKIPVRDYKKIASVQVLLNEVYDSKIQTSPVERVKIKNTLIESMSKPKNQLDQEKIDNVTFAVLCSKFNKRYSQLMNEDQKEILSAWSTFLIDGNTKKANSILENKIEKLKNSLSTHSSLSKHKNSDYQPLLKEAFSELSSKKPKLNEESVYEMMRYYDLVEDLNNYNEQED